MLPLSHRSVPHSLPAKEGDMSPISSATKLAQFGVIGLGVMGENLALNIEEHGQSVAVWNLEAEWVDRHVAANRARQSVGSTALD